MQESLFGSEPDPAVPAGDAAAAAGAAIAVPRGWADLAVEACFGAQKKRWAALEPAQREEAVAAMWAYSQAREKAIQAPLVGVDAQPALSGWIGADPLFAAPLRVLSTYLVATSDIPRPFEVAQGRAAEDAPARERQR